MNLYQAFYMNGINFLDPMGKKVMPGYSGEFASYMYVFLSERYHAQGLEWRVAQGKAMTKMVLLGIIDNEPGYQLALATSALVGKLAGMVESGAIRLLGAIQTSGGVAMVVAGKALAMSGAGAPLGGALIVRGADHIGTGISTALTGDYHTTATHKILKKGASLVTDSEGIQEIIAAGGEIVLPK